MCAMLRVVNVVKVVKVVKVDKATKLTPAAKNNVRYQKNRYPSGNEGRKNFLAQS